MMKFFLSTFVFLAIAGSSARAEDMKEFEPIPLGTWVYPALQKLSQITQVRAGKPPLTRYEFAVALVRWMNEHPQDVSSAQQLQARDIGTALAYEFAPELRRINSSYSDREDQLAWIEKRNSTSPSEWYEVWRNAPSFETRIEAPSRTIVTASFLRRRAYSSYIKDSKYPFVANEEPGSTIYSRYFTPRYSK